MRASRSATSRPSSSSSRTTRRRQAGCSISLPRDQGPALEAEFARAGLFLARVGAVAAGAGVSLALTRVGGVETGAQPLPRVRGTALSLGAFRRLAWVSAGDARPHRRHRRDRPPDGLGSRLRALAGLRAASLRAEELSLVHRVLEPRRRVLHDPGDARRRSSARSARGCRRGSVRSRSRSSSARSLQAPLGAITIHYHLNPWLVLSHFLLSVVVLTLGVALAVEVDARRPAVRVPAGSCDWAARRSPPRRSC